MQPPVSENIIRNNTNIKIDNKPIYYPHYVKAGILTSNQLPCNLDTVESYNRAKREGLRNVNFLTWTGIRNAIPSKLKVSDVTEMN